MIGTIGNNPSSRPKKTENDPCLDWENHLIIRFPSDIAQKIKEYLNEDAHHNNDNRLSISFNSNYRTGNVQFDRQRMEFSLYDLPCVTEVMKTLDNKTIYKVTDISQMIVCLPTGGKTKNLLMRQSTDDSFSQTSGFEWPHGLCPPMINARRKRFRKVKRKKYMDAADVERELKRLLRSDLEAVSVRWEVVSGEESEKNMETPLQEDIKVEGSTHATVDEHNEYGLSLSESDSEDMI